mgnify:CR=1 FL=1
MKEETTITFFASECGEFHGMGECIECTSLKEAFRHYQRFCKRSPQMLPSLEFSLHHADDPLYNEGEYPLATGEKGKELCPMFLLCQSSAGAGSSKGTGTAGEPAEETKKRGRER